MSVTAIGQAPAALPRCLPFVVYMVVLALCSAPDAAWLAVAADDAKFDARWLYALRIGLAAATLLFYRRDYVELAESTALRAADWALSLLVGAGVFVVWINLDGGWARLGGAGSAFVPLGAGQELLWPLIGVRLFGAVAVVPVMEELFWRSFVQRWIDRADFLGLAPSAVSWRAVGLSSLAFGFEHGQWLAGIVAGLAYGGLYRRSGNLWLPIIAHALTNLLLGGWVVSRGQWQFW